MVKTDFTFNLDESLLTSYMGKTVEKKMKDTKNKNVFPEVREQFYQVVDPFVVWNTYKIKDYIHDSVILENMKKMGNGPFNEVIAGASEVVVAICTVGKKLEERSRELRRGGSVLKGIFLDGLASWAVDDLRCQFYSWAVPYFKSKNNYRCSTFLSPGESEWRIEDQKTIYEILEYEALEKDIQITDSNLLVPFKSLSLAFGVGSGVLGSEGGSNCDLCVMRDRCRFRKMRVN